MNIESIISFTRHSRLGFWCLLLAFLLTGLTAGCSHQPWDIDTYIQNLERPERDEYQQPEKVVEALNITPGMVVADVGAGSGYFTRRFAKAVGETGHVLAVDIEQKMLDYNKQELEKLGMANRSTFILANRTIRHFPKTAWTWSFCAMRIITSNIMWITGPKLNPR
ncbi:class I SAM-dependent methyltransferase [Candidatus Nitrospira neomarina]|uniref:Protein-L-isoaspartate O-methyltransferase n=1 Tax=Candidatus Nitrospira neomarina TaxID=3020899 RepID=A0AA96JVT3_9BACT|nr:methyltransferase domain-containing protein [Candidatus Nitrospira neomarina]WNM61350.1 methyltransferase domain-containing protein [Candidatus Nitrospira neomarina]